MHMQIHMCHDVCIGVQASFTLKVLMFCNKMLIAPLMSQGSVPVASFTSRGLTCISNRHGNAFHLSLLACCQSALASTKYPTGKLERTCITRHAKAEQDPFAALASLLAHEIENNGLALIDMLQSGSIDSETCKQLLWRSRVFFPNSDKNNSGRTNQIESLLEKVVKQIPGWDKAKDKHTGLFRKTAAGNCRAAGAAPDEVNRYFGWKIDVQNRFYASHHTEAGITIQAVLAGFDKDSWKQNHHLGRAAVDVDEAWCDALLPGLSATAKLSDLSVRRKELKDTLLKLAEAYWQALPIKAVKYGLDVVAGLPRVQEVMQTNEYASFSDRVLKAECDSMEKLQMMQEVSYLAEWQQANYATPESQKVAHHSDQSEYWETRQQSQIRSAEAAEIVIEEPPTKRQKIASDAADNEQQMETELEQLRSHRRQKELQLQIDTEKQADIRLGRMAELQAATARQDDLELAKQEEMLRRRQLMWSAQGGSALTAQAVSASSPNQDVQPNNIPFTLETQNQAALSVSGTAEDSTVPAAQSSKVKKVLKNPDMFKAQTIDGRYKEWVGGGQYASIKSQVSRSKRGWELPRTKGTQHVGGASERLRRNVHLPEAIEHLVIQGLSEDAAVALVTQVVSDFGLRSISMQSEAFAQLDRLEKAVRAGDATQIAKVETKKLSKTGRTVKEFRTAFDQATHDASFEVFLLQQLLT